SARRAFAKTTSVIERLVLPSLCSEEQRPVIGQVRHALAHDVGDHRPAIVDPQHVLRERRSGVEHVLGRKTVLVDPTEYLFRLLESVEVAQVETQPGAAGGKYHAHAFAQ